MDNKNNINQDIFDTAAELRRWNNAMSAVIRYAIRDTSVSAFARKINYARSTLHMLLNQDDVPKQRGWTPETLLAIAHALGCSFPELMSAALTQMQNPTGAPGLAFRVMGTDPHSRERLQRLVYEAVGYDGEHDRTKLASLEKLAYRLKDIELANPEFCEAYYNGALSDAEALAILQQAQEATIRQGEEDWPLWAALKEVYKAQ